jgi:hypothetical protein
MSAIDNEQTTNRQQVAVLKGASDRHRAENGGADRSRDRHMLIYLHLDPRETKKACLPYLGSMKCLLISRIRDALGEGRDHRTAEMIAN